MKRIKNWFKLRRLNRVNKWISKNYGYCDKYIVQWYKTLRRSEEFVLSTHMVHVKKGKRRYKLLILETTQGKIKITINRHVDFNKPLTISG